MLALLGPGDTVSTIVGAGPLEALCPQTAVISLVPPDLLANVVRQRPAVAMAVIEALSHRIQVLRQVAASLGEMRAENRLWARMCHFAEDMGVATSDGAVLDLPLTHERWGMPTGASREAIVADHARRRTRAPGRRRTRRPS